MSQRHWGDAVKNVLGIAAPAVPEVDEARDSDGEGPEHRPDGRWLEVSRRDLWIRRQPVDLWPVHEEIERVEASEHLLVGAVQIRAALAGVLQLTQSSVRHFLEIDDGAEVDRPGRTGLGAGGLEAHLHAVVAERALLRGPRHRVDADDAEGAGPDAITTTVARIGLDDNRVQLGADDGARRAHLQAAGPHAMLADVAHHEPAPLATVRGELLDELHVPPVDAVEVPRVVVAIAAERAHSAVRRRQLIPLLAGDLARLAPDAHRRVREEPHGLSHHAAPFRARALPAQSLLGEARRGPSRPPPMLITPSPRCRRRPSPRGSRRWDPRRGPCARWRS